MTMYLSTNRDYQGDRVNYEMDNADPVYSQTSDTGWRGNVLDPVQRALAAYDGDDIWADVITRLDVYDPAATAFLAPVCANPVFVAVTGTAYQWCPELGLWQAVDARADIGEAFTDPLRFSMSSFLGLLRGRRGRSPRSGGSSAR
jgi:hypothetical protein